MPSQVHFDVIAKVLLRARNLKVLRLEGPQIAQTKQIYEDYIPCRLQYLILMFTDITLPVFKEILIRSGRSLRSLHIEHVTNLESSESMRWMDLRRSSVVLTSGLSWIRFVPRTFSLSTQEYC